MATHEEAAAALEALDSKFSWEGMASPMIVKWMDAGLQKRRREQHLASALARHDLLLPPQLGLHPPAFSQALGLHAGMHQLAQPMRRGPHLSQGSPGERRCSVRCTGALQGLQAAVVLQGQHEGVLSKRLASASD
jgi:hypothetical protein